MMNNVPPGADKDPRAPWRQDANEPFVCSECGTEIEEGEDDALMYCPVCEQDERVWKESDYLRDKRIREREMRG